ncbi:hypothetical protein PAXINDRAFT_21098 [Paxillus involutus ATCC 200175]|uniref:Uncharacterized protein n=1 Tax=Paxillus involutus ATCC 200175 TaxID=664439 RepID=A0A0C9TEP5_PAXIN|nr:hypothetical protein PAXINDRAFT_21098 [Paxillus involutus ATCC 200175]
MNNIHNTYLGEVVTSIKEAKTLEATYYGDLITPSIYIPAISQIAQQVYDKLKDKNKVPRVSADAEGELSFSTSSVIPPHVVARHGALLHELPVLGVRIITLARTKVNAKQQRTDRKKVIKRVADAEAGTLGQNKASISKMVQTAVRNQLKSRKGNKAKAGTVRGVFTSSNDTLEFEPEGEETGQIRTEETPEELAQKATLQRFRLSAEEAEEVQESAWFEVNTIPLEWLLNSFLEDQIGLPTSPLL